MNKINVAYVIGLFCIGCYPDDHGVAYGIGFVWWVFFVSMLLALSPLATSRFWFALPIVIILWVFLAPASWTGDRYDSDFGWLCLIYIPFHYISFLSNVIDAVKGIFDID